MLLVSATSQDVGLDLEGIDTHIGTSGNLSKREAFASVRALSGSGVACTSCFLRGAPRY
jgi:hypothetical protein